MKTLLSLLILFISLQTFAQNAPRRDSSFGNAGFTTSQVIAPYSGAIKALALLPNGEIAAAGYAEGERIDSYAVAVYKSNGTLDSTFSPRVLISNEDYERIFYGIAAQTDGNIVCAGQMYNENDSILNDPIPHNSILCRFTAHGVPDSSFGKDGFVPSIGQPDSTGAAFSVKIQPDGKIVTGGVTGNLSYNYLLSRFNAYGRPDSSFGLNGFVIGPDSTRITSITLQPDGKIVAAGNNALNRFFVARFTSNGKPDSTFAGTGLRLEEFGYNSTVRSVIVLPDGRIIAGGTFTDSLSFGFGLSCYLPDGNPDNTFGNNGRVQLDLTPPGGFSELYALAVQTDGEFIAAGYTDYASKSSNAIVRFNKNGSLDNSFGSGGKFITDSVMSSSSVLIQPDGKIITAGVSKDYFFGFAIARYLVDFNLGIIDFKRNDKTVFVYPNPLVSNAELKYTLKDAQPITISLIDMQGRALKTYLQNQLQPPGEYMQTITLPQGLANGAYLVVLSSQEGKESVKVVK